MKFDLLAEETQGPEHGTLGPTHLVASIEHPAGNLAIAGMPDAVREVVALLQSGGEEASLNRAELMGQKIGYFLVCSGPRGIISAHCELDSPIRTHERILELQAEISKQTGGPIAIIDWRPLERQRVVAATAVPKLVTQA